MCDEGYSGARCDTQPTGGKACESDQDCGNGVGGICHPVTHTCECYKGWTCPGCDKVGSVCDAAAMIHGGGSCESNKDCGNFGPDFDNPEKTGGKCEGGICVCFEGFTCTHCTKEGNPEDVVNGNLVCDGAKASSISYMVLMITILAIYVFYSICFMHHIIHNYMSLRVCWVLE